jgi:uncharacterized protein YaiI (UPF0178 family)
MNFSLWVDADSCPVPVRELIIKFILRLNIPCYFVANRVIPFSPVAKKTNLITMIITENIEGSADDYIVEHAQLNDIVITRDIPLAARLIKKHIITINDRGKLFSPDTIREDLSIRNFNYELVKMGIEPERTNNFTKKNLNNFANCFDRELQKKIKKEL